MKFLRRLDLADWVLVLAVLVRIDVAFRFDLKFGYDALTHFAYADLLATGRIPRLWETNLGSAAYAVHHPPLYYLAATWLGFGRHGGSILSILSGAARLWMANRIFARDIWLTPRARLFANVVHGFIPFAVRIDVFYSNEGLAATLALAGVFFALRQRPLTAGIALGAGFLTKASAVAGVPGVIVANLFTNDLRLRITKKTFVPLCISGAVSAALLLTWAAPNITHYGTPYPSVYQPNIIAEVDRDPRFKLPFFLRHDFVWWLPIFRPSDLATPYYGGEENLIRVMHFDAWADYYNFLHPEGPADQTINGKALTQEIRATHVAFVTVGLGFAIAMVFGMVDAAKRLLKRRMTRAELAVAMIGAVYLLIAIIWGASVPFAYHGAVKAVYALGAVVILSCWIGRTLDRVTYPKWIARVVDVFALSPVVLMIWQRIVW